MCDKPVKNGNLLDTGTGVCPEEPKSAMSASRSESTESLFPGTLLLMGIGGPVTPVPVSSSKLSISADSLL